MENFLIIKDIFGNTKNSKSNLGRLFQMGLGKEGAILLEWRLLSRQSVVNR